MPAANQVDPHGQHISIIGQFGHPGRLYKAPLEKYHQVMNLMQLQALRKHERFEVLFGALLKEEADLGDKRFFLVKGYAGELEIVFSFL
jgi:hypothetical protein